MFSDVPHLTLLSCHIPVKGHPFCHKAKGIPTTRSLAPLQNHSFKSPVRPCLDVTVSCLFLWDLHFWNYLMGSFSTSLQSLWTQPVHSASLNWTTKILFTGNTKIDHIIITFTFINLADTFIQSDFQERALQNAEVTDNNNNKIAPNGSQWIQMKEMPPWKGMTKRVGYVKFLSWIMV